LYTNSKQLTQVLTSLVAPAATGKKATSRYRYGTKSRLKLHELSLPNAPAKQQRKGTPGMKQPAAVGSKQKPAGKATSKR